MKKRQVVPMMALALSLSLPAEGRGQASVHPYVGYDVDIDEALIGGSVQFAIPGAAIAGVALRFSPGFSYYLRRDGATFLVVDLDARYPFAGRNVAPYVGGGVFLRRVSVDVGTLVTVSDTDAGLNIVGGAAFGPSRRVRPFAEGRLRLGDGPTFVLLGGLAITLGA
jgi:hypothetical protein